MLIKMFFVDRCIYCDSSSADLVLGRPYHSNSSRSLAYGRYVLIILVIFDT